MIRVHVKILGALAKPRGSEFSLELPDQSRVEDLLLSAGYAKEHARFIVPAVNGAQQRMSHPLMDGDEVLLVLPTSGG